MKNILKTVLLSAAVSLIGLSCNYDSSGGESSDGGNGSGKGGSMARFTIAGDHIYTVDNYKNSNGWREEAIIKVVDISTADQPIYLEGYDTALTNPDAETIFPLGDKLFIGSRTAMYIYDISAIRPEEVSETNHFSSCDPVVSDGDYAYVTLNSDNASCWRGRNELKVYDISDPYSPQLVLSKTNMSGPKGLAVDPQQKLLFVCDAGLKVYDTTDPTKLKRIVDIYDIPQAYGIDTYDVIALDGLLVVTGRDGLFQFGYTREKFEFLSKIDLRLNK